MKLDVTKADVIAIKRALYAYGIGEAHPSFDDFLSDALWEIALMISRKPDYVSSPGLKRMIIKRSLFTTMAKLGAKKRKYLVAEWRGTDIDKASVPSTVEARIDAKRAFELLPERAQDIVVNRMMGETDSDWARENNISRQAINWRMRHGLKKVKKELR